MILWIQLKGECKKSELQFFFSITGSGVCEVELEIEFIPKYRPDCWQELVDIENYRFCGDEQRTKRNFLIKLTYRVTHKG